MFRSVQWRIAVPFILLILVSMGALGFYLTDFVREARLDDLRDQLESEALLIKEASLPLLESPLEETAPLDALAKTLGREIGARVTLIAADGTVLGDSEEDPVTMENHSNRPEVRSALGTGYGQSTRYSTTLSERLMYVAVPIRSGQTVVGVARVALPVTKIERFTDRLVRTVALAMGLTALFAAAVAIVLARATTRPVRAVSHAARRMASGDLDQTVRAGTRDEVGELAGAFNEMSRNLKRLISDLSAERNKLAAVLSAMADGVIMLNREGRIVMTNPAAERLFSLKQGEVIGRTLMEAIRDHEVNDLYRSSIADGKEHAAQIEDAVSKRLLRVIATPFPDENGQEGVLLVFQDLTEVRRLQTVRQTFIGNISHELRTPLAGIKAAVETLKEGAMDDPKAARDFLDRIEGEADRMAQMVRELTELSRIESGEMQLRMAPVRIADLVGDAVERLKPQAERKGVTLETTLPPDLPPARAEADRIRQVLMNLLHNAVKFTPPGGRVRISAAAEEDRMVVSVADTGVGISPDDLPRVFERFYKADKSRSTEGTGLGLAIAKHIVQAHGGRIWAESERGKGSVFTFTIPLTSDNPA